LTEVTFPEATSLAPPYAVPASDWTAIKGRVALTIEMQNVAPEIEKYIPNYPDLLTVCLAWRSTTWSGLIAQAVNTGLFATKAAGVLGQLSGDLNGVKPGDPVPAAIAFIVEVQFGALARTAGQQGTTASGLEGQIGTFVTANRVADASLEKLPLGGWDPITEPISTLDQATADLQTGWGAIAGQLQAFATGQLKITTAGLLASNLSTAITSWNSLAQAANSFVTGAASVQPDPAP
jgi:hypothetical protein